MATGGSSTAGPNRYVLLNQVKTDENLLKQYDSAAIRRGIVSGVVEVLDEPVEVPENYEHTSHLLMLGINGDSELPDQKVSVEYLKREQKMLIPAALGMNPFSVNAGMCSTNAALALRYKKLAACDYRTVRSYVLEYVDNAVIRDNVDALPVPAATFNADAVTWRTGAYYDVPDAEGDPKGFHDVVFGAVSGALQFNCDIRDMGLLNAADMTVRDGDWKTAHLVPPERLGSRLRPLTLQMIAGLNYKPVGSVPMAALVRSYGLSMGVLPHPSSKSIVEYRFTTRVPDKADIDAIMRFQKSYVANPFITCANVLAIFGLLHLAKDHTYRTNDANMARIGISYLRTLRTSESTDVVQTMIDNLEAYIRTAPHPFGLAQTYWLALAMKVNHKLTVPLAKRTDATPPPVQRLMIVRATRDGWYTLPIGKEVDLMFTEYVACLAAEYDLVMQSPPSYSVLHSLYDVAEQAMIGDLAAQSIYRMMPAVYGYIVNHHKNEKGDVDGLGHAQSLKNIERDHKGIANLWANAWEQYGREITDQGLKEFVNYMRENLMKGIA